MVAIQYALKVTKELDCKRFFIEGEDLETFIYNFVKEESLPVVLDYVCSEKFPIYDFSRKEIKNFPLVRLRKIGNHIFDVLKPDIYSVGVPDDDGDFARDFGGLNLEGGELHAACFDFCGLLNEAHEACLTNSQVTVITDALKFDMCKVLDEEKT